MSEVTPRPNSCVVLTALASDWMTGASDAGVLALYGGLGLL